MKKEWEKQGENWGSEAGTRNEEREETRETSFFLGFLGQLIAIFDDPLKIEKSTASLLVLIILFSLSSLCGFFFHLVPDKHLRIKCKQKLTGICITLSFLSLLKSFCDLLSASNFVLRSGFHGVSLFSSLRLSVRVCFSSDSDSCFFPLLSFFCLFSHWRSSPCFRNHF